MYEHCSLYEYMVDWPCMPAQPEVQETTTTQTATLLLIMMMIKFVMFRLRHNMKLRSLLEHEPGAPPPAWAAAGLTGLTEPETALAGAPLWELALLHKHYHSHLSQAAAAVALIPPQGSPSYPLETLYPIPQ